MRGGLDADSATSTYDTIMQLEEFVAAQDRGEGPAQTPAPTATTPKE